MRVLKRIIYHLESFFLKHYHISHEKIKMQGLPILDIKKEGTLQIDDYIYMVNDARHSTLGINRKCKIVVYPQALLHFKGLVSMSNTVIVATEKIEIGKNVMIGGGCTIVDSDFHTLDYSCWNSPKDEECMKRKPVVIGDNVFLGMGTVVLKGVHIGSGAVVAAKSVVFRDIPSDEIWGGNPAVFIRRRK